MFVYFIFKDAYDIYEPEIDHQYFNFLINTEICKKLYSARNIREEDENEIDKELCSLCLEEIYFPRILQPQYMADYVFCDMTKYNYNNSEYTHTCTCRPSLHCGCFIEIYHKQKGCLICKKEIQWKYKYLYKTITQICNYVHDNIWERMHLFMNIGFMLYVLSVIYENMAYDQ